MKRLFIILTLSLIVLLGSCSNQKNIELESKNKQLQHQIDSLTQIADKFRIVASANEIEAVRQRNMADSARKVAMWQKRLADESRKIADLNAMEAKRQQHIAIVQADSATRARNRAILSAQEAAKQRERAIKAEKALK